MTKDRLETDIQGIWPEPLLITVNTLQKTNDCFLFWHNNLSYKIVRENIKPSSNMSDQV